MTTFKHLLAQYFDDLRVKNWSPATIERRKNSLGRFVSFLTDRSIVTMSEITQTLIESYQRSLFHVGNLRTGEPLSFGTQASYLSAVGHWLHWCAVKKHIAFNPAVGIELPKEEFRLPSSYLNIEEVETLLLQPDVTTKLGIRDRSILEILYSSGIRRNELLKLALYDIDRSRKLLTIRLGKGRKDRVVPITQSALGWLEKYTLEVRSWIAGGNAIIRSNGRSQMVETDRLFLGNNGSAMHPVVLSQLVRKYLDAAGIEKSGACHMLRHTTATLMLENGADLRSLQMLLGHANLNTTQIYTHVTIDRLRQVHKETHPGNQAEQAGGESPEAGEKPDDTQRESDAT